jgi:hypothetical protein
LVGTGAAAERFGESIAKSRLGVGGGLVKSASKQASRQEIQMADDKVHPTATEMDYPAHHRNYAGFLNMLKYTIIITAIVTAIVLYTIAN